MDVRTGEIVIQDKKVVESLKQAPNKALFRFVNPPDDFEKQVEMGYIRPLQRLPNRSCKKCFGRGHRGKNVKTGLYIPCSCVL